MPTMKAYELGVLTSYSRPRVSNDNPFAEALFRTVKYAPSFHEHGKHPTIPYCGGCQI